MNITLTGIDEKTDICGLLEMSTDNHVEFGALYSVKRQGEGRYPRFKWIYEATHILDRVALHVCGAEARAQLLAGRIPVEYFSRVQINGKITPADLAKICNRHKQVTFITQYNTRFGAEHLENNLDNHQILVDGSGGLGISPEEWRRPNTFKAVGFAGGLGLENLRTELPKILNICGENSWIDMENKLRIDDVFCVDIAEGILSAFHLLVMKK